MEALSPSTINVQLSAFRKMVGGQARRHDRPGGGCQPDRHPKYPPERNRLGNWLTREQAKEFLAVPRPVDAERQADYVTLSLWSAAPFCGTSWRSSMSRPSSNERDDGF
jgi:hypothetical protein